MNPFFRLATGALAGPVLLAAAGCQPGLRHEKPVAVENAEIKHLHAAGDVYTCGVATQVGLQELKDRGVRTVIDLRLPEQVPAGYPREVEALGLEYIPRPMRSEAVTDEQADLFVKTMKERGTQPVAIQCGSSNRSGAMYGIYRYSLGGVTVEQALELAREAGMTNPQLETDVRRYMITHQR
jgi:protein tyrosine phosphatase (PTP) superfamily phosphohydrolase (DUF442 family)